MYRIFFYNGCDKQPIFISPPFNVEKGELPSEYLAGVLSTILQQGFMIFDDKTAIMAGCFSSAIIEQATVAMPRFFNSNSNSTSITKGNLPI